MKFMGLLCVLLVLTACGALDNSMLETAETIKPGSIKAGFYTTEALDMNKMLFLKNQYSLNPSSDDVQPQPTGSMGARVSIGIINNVEIIGKASAEANEKIALKYRLPLSQPKISVAIMPTYTYFRGHYPNPYAFSVGKDSIIAVNPGSENYKSNGFELPMLLTYTVTPHTSLSFSMKAAYYPIRYRYHYKTTDYSNHYTYYVNRGKTTMYMYGISANLQLSSRHFYIMPAIGFDYVYIDSGKKGLVSTLGIGYGFQIYPF